MSCTEVKAQRGKAGNFTDLFLLKLLPLPPGGWDGTITHSRIEFNDLNPPETIPVPSLDPIQSKFSQEYLSIRFTIEFLEKAKIAMGSIGFFNFQNSNVNAAVWLYNDLADRSFLFTSDNERIRDVIAFYSTNFLGVLTLRAIIQASLRRR